MKKRILSLFIGVFVIASFTACSPEENGLSKKENAKTNDEIKTIQLTTGQGRYEEFDENTYATYISESHPVVYLYYGDENKYSDLANALEENNKSEKEYQLKFLNDNKDYAAEYYIESDDEFFHPFESIVEPYVRRADTLCTSILYCGYEYVGGIHGNYYYYGENYNTKTGKKLTLSDVINDKEKLVGAVLEQLDKHWSDTELNETFDVEELINDETLVSWTLDYNGITIYFMPYSIASYASGVQIVTVSNEEYPGVLKEEYKKTPKSYGFEIAKDVPFYYDVTGDGTVDEIMFTAYEGGFDGNPGRISICVNKTAYDEEDWMYGAEATFIHAKDGKNYIYVEVLRENDYRQTICYDLSYGVKNIGELDGGLRRIFHEGDDNVITQDVLTDPESFYLGKTTQVLSTAKGFKEYAVDETGLPESDDKWYEFDEESAFTFTFLQDIDVDIYDKKTDTISGTKTLYTGDKVVYIATDGESRGLLKCEDGTILCMEYKFDEEKFYMTVNGIKIEEILDGVVYAG